MKANAVQEPFFKSPLILPCSWDPLQDVPDPPIRMPYFPASASGGISWMVVISSPCSVIIRTAMRPLCGVSNGADFKDIIVSQYSLFIFPASLLLSVFTCLSSSLPGQVHAPCKERLPVIVCVYHPTADSIGIARTDAARLRVERVISIYLHRPLGASVLAHAYVRFAKHHKRCIVIPMCQFLEHDVVVYLDLVDVEPAAVLRLPVIRGCLKLKCKNEQLLDALGIRLPPRPRGLRD